MNAVIALNPQQMAEAQATTISWILAKLKSAQEDFDVAEGLASTLRTYGLRVEPAERQMDKAKRRITYYEKVRAALDAGYYIIPPFDIQVFAIRTDRKVPNSQAGDASWGRDQNARALPIGVGRYVNPVPVVRKIGTEPRLNHDKTTTREVTIFANTDWRDELDMPVRALKPQVIEATGQALQLKIFDALGIAPAYRSADPIIAGQIKRPDGKGELTFFVAWWLDKGDL